MRVINSIMVVAVALITLSGCGVYSSFQRSELPTAEDYLYRNNLEQNEGSLASMGWQQLFTDNHLKELINEALKSNTNLNVARMKVDDAEASLKTARLSYLPSLNLAPQGTSTGLLDGQSVDTYNLAAQASWEIDIFGKVRNSKEKAKAVLMQSEAYAQAVETQVISTLANSYYSLLTLDMQRKISEQTIANWEQNIKMLVALKRAGMTNETAVAQAKANVLGLKANLESIVTQIEVLENTICSMLARAPQRVERGSLLEQNFPESVSVGVPLEMVSKRPDVLQAEYYLAQMFYATNEARAAFYPSITLSGSVGWTNSAVGVISNPGEWVYNAVASALQPIFNKGALNARLKISKSQQEQALLQYKQTILDAANEVNSNLLDWQTARKRLEFDSQQITELQKALRSAELLMKHSNATYLDVITAQNSLLQAQLNQANDKYNEIQGVINLYRSLGGK